MVLYIVRRCFTGWSITHMDEFVDDLLHKETVIGIALPRLPKVRVIKTSSPPFCQLNHSSNEHRDINWRTLAILNLAFQLYKMNSSHWNSKACWIPPRIKVPSEKILKAKIKRKMKRLKTGITQSIMVNTNTAKTMKKRGAERVAIGAQVLREIEVAALGDVIIAEVEAAAVTVTVAVAVAVANAVHLEEAAGASDAAVQTVKGATVVREEVAEVKRSALQIEIDNINVVSGRRTAVRIKNLRLLRPNQWPARGLLNIGMK